MKQDFQELLKTSGINDNEVIAIQKLTSVFIEEAETFKESIKDLVITDVNDVETMNKAKEKRLIIKKSRIKAIELVKEQRDAVQKEMLQYTAKDKMWLKTAQLFEKTFKEIELNLSSIENYAIIENQKRLDALKEKRLTELKELGLEIPQNVETLTDEMFEIVKSGLITKKAEDEKLKAEEEKIKAEAKQRVIEAQKIEKMPEMTESEVLLMWVKTFEIKDPIKFNDSAIAKEIKTKFQSFVKWSNSLIIENGK